MFVVCVRSSSLARLSEEGQTDKTRSLKMNINEFAGGTGRDTAAQKSAMETQKLDVRR